jgi:hypothetical protein
LTEGFIFADEAEAQRACEWWQGQLGLADWEIHVHIKRAQEMENKEAQGEYTLEACHRWAAITLCNQIDYPLDTSWPQDQERTLLHEMGHILHWFTQLDDKDAVLEHQIVCSFAHTLVRLRRLAYPGAPWKSHE